MVRNQYVYVVRAGHEIVYVGSGKGDRYLHVTSGRSHNDSLNFLNRQGIQVDVEIVMDCLTVAGARSYEQDLIDLYSPPFNKGIAAGQRTKDESLRQESSRRQPNYGECVLALAKVLFHIGDLDDVQTLVLLSFEINSTSTSGSISYTTKELKAFIADYAPWYVRGGRRTPSSKVATNLHDILEKLGCLTIVSCYSVFTKDVLKKLDGAIADEFLTKSRRRLHYI